MRRPEPSALLEARRSHLSRIAFGAGNYRVFYNDPGEAIAWLMAD